MSNLHSQDFQIQLKRGTAANINATATINTAVEAEPHYTTDSETLYIYDGALNRPVAAQLPVAVKTEDYTATNADCVILVSGETEITLPAATDNKKFIIKNTGTDTVSITPNGSETIDGAAGKDLTTQYQVVQLVGYDGDWYIISTA